MSMRGVQAQLKNFQNLMKKILQNRKSAAGLIMLLFFAFLAIFGPLFVRDDPIQPGSTLTKLGYMPLAHYPSVPEWYRGFTGNPKYTNNIYALSDAKFSDPNELKNWQNTTTSSEITVSYDANANYFNQATNQRFHGCIAITFTNQGNATLTTQFNYPYEVPPTDFATEIFYSIQTQNQTGVPGHITLMANFIRPNAEGQSVFPATTDPNVVNSNVTIPLTLADAPTPFALIPGNYISSTNTALFNIYGDNPDQFIFIRPGPYEFQITIQFTGNATASGNPTVLFGNVNLLLYGNSFGLLGADDKQRDLFTQLIAGTQISFILGLVTAILSVGIGLIVGLVAGYIGGATDEVLMRINDLLLVIPSLPLLIVLSYVLGESLFNLIIIIGVLGWMGFARTVRSAILSLKERQFIEAVRSAGGGRFYIIRKHLVPNVFPLVYITLAMSVPGAIVTEAALSFLGLGPKDVMSWGRILYEFESSGNTATGAFTVWYWVIPPGIFICLLSLSFILIGFALDEILNPRLRER